MLYAISASVLWGLLYVLNDILLKRSVSPLVFLCLCSFINSTILVSVLVSKGELGSLSPAIKNIGLFQMLAIGFVAITAQICIFKSIQAIGATEAALIELSYPIFVALFAYFLSDLKLDWHLAGGAVLILAGVVIISQRNSASFEDNTQSSQKSMAFELPLSQSEGTFHSSRGIESSES